MTSKYNDGKDSPWNSQNKLLDSFVPSSIFWTTLPFPSFYIIQKAKAILLKTTFTNDSISLNIKTSYKVNHFFQLKIHQWSHSLSTGHAICGEKIIGYINFTNSNSKKTSSVDESSSTSSNSNIKAIYNKS